MGVYGDISQPIFDTGLLLGFHLDKGAGDTVGD
jgi:hypothetical protein